MFPAQSRVAWKGEHAGDQFSSEGRTHDLRSLDAVCLGALHAFAVGSTGLRLWDRFQNRKLWWDDYIALLPMLCDAFYSVLFYLRFRPPGESICVHNPRRTSESNTAEIF